MRPTQPIVHTLKYLHTPGAGSATTPGKNSIDFSASLTDAKQSSDNATRDFGQVSAGFPSLKELRYAYDITLLYVTPTF
jgi:hypothetical protein